jgi:hypothetical protein
MGLINCEGFKKEIAIEIVQFVSIKCRKSVNGMNTSSQTQNRLYVDILYINNSPIDKVCKLVNKPICVGMEVSLLPSESIMKFSFKNK